MSDHKSYCNNPNSPSYNLPIYQHIRELGGWNMVRHVMIEEFRECQNKLQLVKREQDHIDQYNGTKNAIRSYRTIEQRNEQIKQYYSDNKAAINEQHKQYRNENAAAIKERMKQYYIDNKAAIKEQKKQYRLKKKQDQA